MPGIAPIPTTRIGDLFARQRLSNQVLRDQLELFRIQNQISTGRRIQLPSEDPSAALRAINLQRLISRKERVQTNIKASEQYLVGANTHLQSITDGLIKLRAEVVGVAGNTNPESARLEAAKAVDALLQALVTAGNSKLHGRYLFAGSSAQAEPYTFDGEYVEFSGNNGSLRSYVDIQRLFETNLPADEVFGAVSVAVEGSSDVNPQLTAGTLVSSLNGGAGIGTNAAITVSINNGLTTESRVINLRTAVTIGDIARMIEDNAPGDVTAEVTGTGLVLRAASGTITVSEAAEGRSARMLGILSDPNVLPTGTINGSDLNPALLKTTRLADMLGTRAQGYVKPPGFNNDIRLTANTNDDDFNGLNVEVVGGGAAHTASASYASGTLTIQIDEATTTANNIVDAINTEGTFTAVADYHDATASHQIGTGKIDLGGAPSISFADVTDYGSGEVLDTAAGLVLTNGGETVTLDISAAETVEDLLNLINGADLGLLAEINDTANGINVRSRLSGADFTIGENGGTTATQLGIRTYNGDTKLSDLNRGLGIFASETGDDLRISARDALSEFTVDLGGAETIDDVINAINAAAAAANGGAGVNVTASLATTGNGIVITDTSAATGDTIIAKVPGSQAAEYLGFVAGDQTQTVSTTGVIQSEDRHTLETDSVFNTLLRLRTALENNDETAISSSLERLDNDINRVNFARAEIGSRLQNLAAIITRVEDEHVQLKTALSTEIDVDLVEAISQLTARQYAFEASLRSAASLMQLSLLNFI
jgi:flagellin-like hook-associated protein FlgL